MDQYRKSFQLVVNVIRGKISVWRDIINFVEDIINICSLLKEVSLIIMLEYVMGKQTK